MPAQKTRWKLLAIVLCVILVGGSVGGVFVNFFLDSDGDGIPNLHEVIKGTNLFNADTDGDKLLDGYNIVLTPENPLAKKFIEDGILHEKVVASDEKTSLVN